MIEDDKLLSRQPASLYRRLIAASIDAVIWISLAFGGYLVAMTAIYDFRSDRAASISLLALYLCMPAYYLTEVFAQCTLGKRWAGITVAVLNEHKVRRRRWARWAIKSSPWLIAFFFPFVASDN